jgi:hypothetical protein
VSALTPHIRVLRALAFQYHGLSDELLARGREMPNGPVRDHTAHHSALLKSLAFAHNNAADQLEAEEAALKPPRSDLDRPITYDPKGKR